jgi:glycosyltransferase involved in cell wall biosynthesis
VSLDLVCLGEADEPKREASENLRIWRIPITQQRGGKLSYAYRYASFIFLSALVLAVRCLRRRYDLVYIHNMPDVLVASALFPKALGAKVILDLHDPMPELMTTIYSLAPNSFAVKAMRSLEKWSLARAHQVLTVNIACQRIFASRSCPAEKISVIMNSPDEQIFPLRPVRSSAALDLAVPKPFVVLYHGSIVERNGLDLAVKAFAEIAEKIPGAELRIFGRRTPFLDEVLAEANGNGLGDRVSYRGPRTLEELVTEIEAGDIGIIPNQRNAFTDINTPTRIFEYLVMGKPVIAPRTQGITDYFDEQSLFFFESGNASDLAQRLEHCYEHRDELPAIAARGQQIYLAHTWPEERKKLVQAIENLLLPAEGRQALAMALE